MKSVMKKSAFVSFVVLFVLTATGCPHDTPNFGGSGGTHASNWYEFPVDAETGDVASVNSTYVYFGVFPKTVLPLNSTVTVYEAQSVTMGANTYYKGSDGNWYAKVKEDGCIMGNEFHEEFSNKYTDGSPTKGTWENSYRYFKVEPIKWRVLTADYNGTEKALLLAENMLNSNVLFYVEDSNRTIGGKTVFPNNYKYSTVRAYLNGTYETGDSQPKTHAGKGFLQTAFTEKAQALIGTTEVDNSAETTGWDFDTYAWNYACENTMDKIFLLSASEMIRSDYGFSSDVYIDETRIRVPTDYAKANFARPPENGIGSYWWVRSPDFGGPADRGVGAHIVFDHGATNGGGTITNPDTGIVPALTIALPSTSQHTFASTWSNDENYHWHAATCVHTSVVGDTALHTWDAGVVTKEPTKTAEGAKKLACTVCGKTKIEAIAKLAGDSFNWYESPVDAVTGLAATKSSEFIYFGVFPKSVLSLNSKVTVDEKVSVTMGANDYYRGSDGNWYAKVRENANGEGVEYTYTDGSQAKKNSADSYRYFKVEPIKWRVLSKDYNGTGKAFLLAEDILTAGVPYYKYSEGSNTRTVGADADIYPSNYKYSTVRAYLNGLDYYYDKRDSSTAKKTDFTDRGFLQTAFTAAAQAKISVTSVDNGGSGTTDAAGVLPKADGSYENNPDYTCAETKDRIFLLSEKEVTTAAYGFAPFEERGEDNTRIRKTTDYAKANYAYQSLTAGYGGGWWLRTPLNRDRCLAYYVTQGGYAVGHIVRDTDYGIGPALTISLQ